MVPSLFGTRNKFHRRQFSTDWMWGGGWFQEDSGAVTFIMHFIGQWLCCVRHCDPMDCTMPSLSLTVSRNLLKLTSMESLMPSNHLILCRPLLLPPTIFPSIRVFSKESALRIRWPKDWSFSFGISPSSEHPGLISFRMDWLDLLAVQGTLKSLLQHHSSKASIPQCLDFLNSPTLTSRHDYWKNHSFD